MTIDKNEIERIVSDKRINFFSPDTKRFFNSRTLDSGVIHNGILYFITSEKGSHQPKRLFTVRTFNTETGNIETLEKFQAFSSKRWAEKAIREATK